MDCANKARPKHGVERIRKDRVRVESILEQPHRMSRILHLLLPSTVLHLMAMQIHITHSSFLLPSVSEPSERASVVVTEDLR